MPDNEPNDVVSIFSGPAGRVIDDLVADEVAALDDGPLERRHESILVDLRRTLGLTPGDSDRD